MKYYLFTITSDHLTTSQYLVQSTSKVNARYIFWTYIVDHSVYDPFSIDSTITQISKGEIPTNHITIIQGGNYSL